MADRRRRRRVKSDEDSEDISSESDVEPLDASFTSTATSEKKEGEKAESEYESAEEEEEDNITIAEKNDTKEPKVLEDDVESPAELIDEEGGEEGIAEAEDVEGEFLDGDILGASEEDGECVEEERQQGDGEECSPVAEKELDFDEDRRNPQYIPKKGTFYEHDDRNLSESPKEKEVEPPRDKKKKKLWLDEGRWGHDRYREDEQIPKSRDELIEAYGYDIRCEDCPPRARRRRRYGRGPTKYERNWKDEMAYSKEQIYNIFRGSSRGGRRGRSRGGRFRGGSFRGVARRVTQGNKFENKDSDASSHHSIVGKSAGDILEPSSGAWSSTEMPEEEEEKTEEKETPSIINSTDFPALSSAETVTKPCSPEPKNLAPRLKKAAVEQSLTASSVRTQTFENSNFTNKTKSSPPPMYERPPRQSRPPSFRGPYRGAYKRPPRIVRGKRSTSGGRFKGTRDYVRPTLAPRLMEKQIRAATAELEQLAISDKSEAYDGTNPSIIQNHKANKMNGIKLNGQSSKNEDTSIRPKRYSSLRQRSLPETSNYQPAQAPNVAQPHPTYYDATYQTAMYAPEDVVAPPSTQPQTTGSPPIINPPQYQTYNPAAFQESYALRLPVNNTPRMFPQAAGQPMMAAAPCITANPGLINYPPPPPAPAPAYPQFTYQQYPAPPPAPPAVSQPPEMYRSGITYYYPQNQHPQVRHVPMKRPKAAIPIVPPPENEVQRKSLEKKDMDSAEEPRRNSLACSGDSTSADSELVRTEPSSSQPPVEVES